MADVRFLIRGLSEAALAGAVEEILSEAISSGLHMRVGRGTSYSGAKEAEVVSVIAARRHHDRALQAIFRAIDRLSGDNDALSVATMP